MTVKKEDLEKYLSRKRELKIKIKRLGNLKVEYVGDSVRVGDARRGPIIKVQGYNSDVIERRAKELRERIEELELETEAVEQWIKELPEGEDRNILELRYLDGKTQTEIAEELGAGYTREAVAKKLQRFWDK